MPDTPQLIEAVRGMTDEFRSLRTETRNLAETHARDLSTRKTATKVLGVAAGLALVLLIAVGALGVVAISTANAVKADAREDKAQRCLTSVAFRADLHRGVDAVLDSLVQEIGDGGASVVHAVENAKDAMRQEVTPEPPCLARVKATK